MRVKEWKGSVVFLHEVAEGAARRSWGVHVAELAGVPLFVVRRAASLMAAMEKHGGPLGASTSIHGLPLFAAAVEQESPQEDRSSQVDMSPSTIAEGRLCLALQDINPDTMSPKQALDALYYLKSLAPACAPGPT
jgi:DNA mismatch repair protein MutS